MAQVLLTDEAKEDIRDLDRSSQQRVLKKLKELEIEPEKRGHPLGSRAGGNLTGLRKLTVGDRQFRIVYRVESDDTVCVVWVIAARADDRCYDLAMQRIEMYSGNQELKENLERLLATAWNRVP